MFGHSPDGNQLASLLSGVAGCLAERLGLPVRLEAGWPQTNRSGLSEHGVRGSGLWLGLGLHGTTAYGALWLETALCVALVEHALGAQWDCGASHRSVALNEAEEGVLAYIAADLATRLGGRLWIRDVTAQQPDLPPPPFLMPLVLSVSDRKCSAFLWLDALLAEAVELRLRLVVPAACEPTTLAHLEPGDVLLADELVLSVSAKGLLGPALALVEGIAFPLPVSLEGDVFGRARAVPAPGTQVDVARAPVRFDTCFVLHASSYHLHQAAALHAEGQLPFTSRGDVSLEQHGRIVARGPLVNVRGKVGVLVRDHAEQSVDAINRSETAAPPEHRRA